MLRHRSMCSITPLPNPGRSKGTVYEEGIHVPMIIAGSAVNAPNHVSNALVSTTYLFGTMLELAGFPDWKAHIPADPNKATNLQLPLATEAQTHYQYLCNEMGNLLGTSVCLQSVGVSERGDELFLSPNPVSEWLNIDGAEEIQLHNGEIFDATGRLVLELKDLKNGSVDVSGIMPGLYFMKMRNGLGQVFLGKFMKM